MLLYVEGEAFPFWAAALTLHKFHLLISSWMWNVSCVYALPSVISAVLDSPLVTLVFQESHGILKK